MKRAAPWLPLCAALSVIAALLGAHAYRSHQDIEKLERERLVHQVDIIERNLSRQLQTTSNALESVRADLPQLLQLPAAPNPRLRVAMDSSLGVRTFSVIGRTGEVIASSRAELLGQDFHDSARFQVIRAANDPALLHVSAPFRTPLGYWSITLARSIRDEQGDFAGCIMALIDPDYFADLVGSTVYAPDMRAGLTHGQGQVIFRVPDAEGITGKDLSQSQETPFSRHLQSGEALSVATYGTTPSGHERMVATRTVRPRSAQADQPIIAVASRETASIFAAWREDSLKSALLFALLAGISVLGLYSYQRRQAAFERLRASAEREHEAAAQTIRQTADRLQLATEGAAVGVWHWDLRSGKVEWSDICKRQFGLPVDQEVTFEQFLGALHPDDRERVAALLRRSQEILEDYRTEYRVVHRDGSEHWLAAMGRYYLDDDGQTIGMGGVTLDISERKQAEAKLEESRRRVETLNRQLEKRALDAETARRAKDAFLRAVSHELRTPLNHIMGGTDILLRGQTDARQEKWLRTIRQSADELLQLVQQVLLAAEKGGAVVELEAVEFRPRIVLDEVRQALLQRAEAKGLSLAVSPAGDLPESLLGDPTRLTQALYNYVENGIKFSEQGTITLAAQTLTRNEQGVVVRFVVTDTGIGITPEVREKLFTDFAQGDSAMTRKYGGLGIGLSNTRELARLMGGEAGVDSLAGGSAFWFTARFGLPPEVDASAT